MNPYTGILLALIASAFFSGIEIAYVTSDKFHFALLKRQGKLSGQILEYFSGRQSLLISALLIGNTVALTFYGIYMALLLDPILVDVLPAIFNNRVSILVIQTIISTAIVLVTAEFLPKSLFIINPTATAEFFAIPLMLAFIVLFIPSSFVLWLSRLFITKLLRFEFREEPITYDFNDFRQYLSGFDESDNSNPDVEVDTQLLKNAVDFKNLQVRDCMVHRTDIEAIEKNDTIENLEKAFVESGYSKILVYEGNIDQITGFVHHSKLFKKPKTINSVCSNISIVSESTPIDKLLVQFISERRSIALVVDEFGGTSGIITLEDIIEEIFGDIEDETDNIEFTEQQIGENTWLMSARLDIDYLNEKYGWTLPEGDYDTLSGLILNIYQDIPMLGEVIQLPPFTFTITAKDKNRIDVVKVQLFRNDL